MMKEERADFCDKCQRFVPSKRRDTGEHSGLFLCGECGNRYPRGKRGPRHSDKKESR